MCGWAGLWTSDGMKTLDLVEQAHSMATTLAHRGPDDADTWVDAQAGFAAGFRRLAIVDLSPDGRQPMCSASGRYVVVFNGEIYNFAALRQQLEPLGHRFRGHSDTEVLLAAVEQWGLQAAIEQFIGMFAFALWDRQQQHLSLVRDRLGIKPLYYGWAGQTLLFGSELKAFHAHPAFRPAIDRGALTLFIRHGYVPAPHTIYADVQKLLPGHVLTFGAATDRDARPIAYWSAQAVAQRSMVQPFTGTPDEATDQLEQLLADAVRLRMIADVPLGAFLSGGSDSSTIVALMQAQSTQPVKTFSIGFHEAHYNEAQHAQAVARQLGTDHTELYVTSAEAQAVIAQLPTIYDEPFADSSQIPTLLVARMARAHVTVSLSGDGGDELFGGYRQYRNAQALWQKLRHVPLPVRRGLHHSLGLAERPAVARWIGQLAPLTGRFTQPEMLAQRIQRLAEILPTQDAPALYHNFISHRVCPEQVVRGGYEPPTAYTDRRRWVHAGNLPQHMMYTDALAYLPDDILTKVDRASMAVSLEARVPLLDHRVVEFAWQLPLHLKLRDGQSKWILRQVLARHIPRALIDRPKQGFSVPIAAWLRGPLREWAEDLLDARRMEQDNFLNPEPVQRRWREHVSGRHDWSNHLWDVLMFQSWLAAWHAPRTIHRTVGTTQ